MNERDRLLALAQLMADGSATAADAARLSQLLRESADLRDEYLRFLDTHAALCWEFREAADLEPIATPVEAPEQEPHRPTLDAPALRDSTLRSAVKSLPFLLLGGPIRGADRWTTAAALLVCYSVFYGACFLIVWSLRPQVAERDPKQLAELAELAAEDIAKGVATLVEARDCDWEAGHAPAPVGGRITTAESLRLHAGHIVLQFDGGAQVGIVGPAVARAASTGYIRLERGRLAAHVPARAFGFTVETASARLVDLGTDFAVDVNEAGEANMVVTRGAVEVAALVRVDGERKTSGPAVRITAGQALTVSPSGKGSAVERSAKPPDWVKQLKLSEETPTALVAYQITNGAAGNQGSFSGGLGLDFDVVRPIQVEALGVFDDLGDGIAQQSQLTVQVWSRERQTTAKGNVDVGGKVLAEQTFDAATPGLLLAGHRFKPLAAPLELPIGSYTIVSYGFSAANRNINFNQGGPTPRDIETWRGAIAHVGSRFGGTTPGEFPMTVEPRKYCYVAGSFKFGPANSESPAKPSAE
jgi:hypothetical protein